MRPLTFERVVIDGVPAYVGNQPGQVTAGITFRVGIGDESALDRGVTALLAELAAIDVDTVEYDVGATRTSFVATGHAAAVADALAAVCRTLPDFDDEDLEQLADTILDEGEPVPSLQTTLLGLRFGAHTYGTIAIPPLGLLHVDGAHARAWAARFFTRRNAVLWSSGPLAPSIALPLPAGERRVPPERTDAECTLPAWCPNAWLGSMFRDAVDCTTIAPGTDATTVALRALEAELEERLHETRLRGFEPQLDIGTWSEELTYLDLSLPTAARANEGIECVLGTIDDFAELGPDPDELEDAIAETDAWATDPANAAAVAEMLANDELRTGRTRTLDEFVGAVNAVTAEQVAAVFGEMRDEIIVAVPSDGEIVDSRFTVLERAGGFAIDGTSYRRTTTTGTPLDDARLTVGPVGVTYASADQVLTVCFDDCVAAVTYPDHSITLYDIDGTTIEMVQEEWRDGEAAFASIEAAIPSDVALTARRSFGSSTTDAPVEADLDA